MRTITGMGLTLRMVTNMITRVVPLRDTALGITRTCTIGIVSPFTDAAITAALWRVDGLPSVRLALSSQSCEIRPRHDKRGVDLISDALPFGGLWYDEPNAVANAIGYANHHSRSTDAVIRVYDWTGNVIETHAHAGDFKEW
jgi:hypothetical protein